MSALIFLTVLGIIILYVGLTNSKKLLAPVAIMGLLVTLYLSWKDWGHGSKYFHDMIIFDNFSIAFNISMIIITILIFLFGIDYYKKLEMHVAEQYALMIFALTGAFLMTSLKAAPSWALMKLSGSCGVGTTATRTARPEASR